MKIKNKVNHKRRNKELFRPTKTTNGKYTSNISNTTNRVNDNFNVYQKTNNEIIEKGIDTTNKYQQETINTIQSISNNSIEL
jgi:hypothetical protein